MQASTPAPSVIRSPSKPRKSPKTASKADTTSGSAPIESQSSARPGPFVSPSSSISGSVGRISQTGSASQNASGSQPQNGSMNSMMSPLMFSSSAATLSHMQQLRLRQHSKTMLLRRLEDGADLCSYTHRVCLQNKLEGFDHCIRHILYDKNNTFRQCSFVHPQSHKRCPNAARKTERKEAICPWHFKKFFLKRKQAQAALEEKCNKGTFTQNAFKELEHYCPNAAHDKKRLNAVWTKQEDHSVTASEFLRQKILEKTHTNEDKESDDELNNPLVDSCFRSDLVDSDSESIDSDHDEALKNAGVYTAEEVSMILRNKMLRLQSLYMNEFKYLRHLLKEKYKKYLFALKNEREIYRIDSQPFLTNKSNSEDRMRLKAMLNYHRHHGIESVLKLQAQEKRKMAINERSDREAEPKSSLSKCIYSKDDHTCGRNALPLSTYCKNHILYDNQQVLFRPCAIGDPPCLLPVISFQKGNTCLLHQEQKSSATMSKLIEEQKLAETTIPTESEVLEAMDEFSAGNTFVSVVEPSGLFALDQFAGFDHSNRPTASSASLPSSSESSSALLVVKSSIN